ncbi:hypothetical protein CCAX7_28030 [Capsulimonas corticalis]|uniref:NmrA-like domain-containing protein n=1 Tax=Capsulimonas corticalis TaxID=2219043 RepID=A0A402CTG3_9BACT|nr:NmrA/HSCARG family protein [Capsulimonas corticalis]BDI30752.1 hypothetical protein CCAX7_28030 [Capsulimonas corticalis]
MNSDKTILVTGATGQQGGAATRRLLEAGFRVRAMTRNPSSDAARALQSAGAEVVRGDFGDRASLDDAARGVYGVFCVQAAYWDPNDDTQNEEARDGKAIADAALAAGARHFVYTSVCGSEGQSLYRRLAKWEIEQYLWTLDLPVTVVRPSFFLENLMMPFFGVPDGRLSLATAPSTALEVIAVDDIGVFAALAFSDPGTWAGKTVDLAGDALTGPEIADALTQALGRPIVFHELSLADIRQINELVAASFQWANDAGVQSDIPALRAAHPGLLRLETWLTQSGADLIRGSIHRR